jgi:hypothetical protein
MTSHPEEFFRPWEFEINSWDEAQEVICHFYQMMPKNRLYVWRGLKSVNYPLHSTLYRELNSRMPEITDKSFAKFENALLNYLKYRWKFTKHGALRIMAEAQHFGGQTRLLDATKSPYIALWFACESFSSKNGEDDDARLFAFDVSDRRLKFTNAEKAKELPWLQFEWGNQARWNYGQPFFWEPDFDVKRMRAQKAGFLVGGLPKIKNGQNSRYRKKPGTNGKFGNWKISQVREATSINVYLHPFKRKPRKNSFPTYVFRISSAAKQEILEGLDFEKQIHAGSLFPDIAGRGEFATIHALGQLFKVYGLVEEFD